MTEEQPRSGVTPPMFSMSRGNGDRLTRTVRSALWAAYGDALGFISELTDNEGLSRRTKGQPLVRPMAWTRYVGGRQGVKVLLPSGCYSDDTQLRLCCSRAIGPRGFDVEAFAKVELTVWPSYALGGGIGTKAAAANLVKDQVAWYCNTFKGWTEAGGNGAAMRVQPHVWAAADLESFASFTPDVLRDAICTHGSPTGILGAVLHAMCTAHAISRGELPRPPDVLTMIQACEDIPEMLMRNDHEIGEIWLGLWNREAGRQFAEAWSSTVSTAREAVGLVASEASSEATSYMRVLDMLKLFDPAIRGSGLLTAIAAIALLWIEPDLAKALPVAAQALGSDTDTIATMAGAVGGAVATGDPDGSIADERLIRDEATRLFNLAEGAERPGHRYPDLLHWAPPRTQADALVEGLSGLEVVGLGPVRTGSEPILDAHGNFMWQWVELDFGQNLLVKRRRVLNPVDGQHPKRSGPQVMRATGANTKHQSRSPRRPRGEATSADSQEPSSSQDPKPLPIDRGVELETAIGWLGENELSDKAIGYAIRRVARDGSPEQLLMLIGILRERLRH